MGDLVDFSSLVQSSESAPAAPAAAPAAEAPKAETKGDDLKIVEGIGPKIAEILNSHGVHTFAELAATEADQIKAWMEEAGSRYKMHDPTTWPDQAAMARDGKWDELKAWQDTHKAGKE